MAILAAYPQEAIFQAAALKEIVEFLLDVSGQMLFLSLEGGLEGWVVLLNQLVK